NYPHLPEGELTNLRSSVVKTQTLADIAKSLKLGMYLKLSRGEEEGGGRNNPSILADTFEALLGAILLDSGLSSVEKILNNFLYILIPQILNDKTYKDSKSSFQEMVQEETKLSPIYKVINETGPDHAKEFTVAVIVKNKVWGQGSGKTKQEAEQKAAASAIEKWQQK
ncbi:ribonuclease III, partial [Candidatus Gottesmanbacteria bacterium RIFCSPLOWO2_02_FULL_38_8]